jgi:hypothetical protein
LGRAQCRVDPRNSWPATNESSVIVLHRADCGTGGCRGRARTAASESAAGSAVSTLSIAHSLSDSVTELSFAGAVLVSVTIAELPPADTDLPDDAGRAVSNACRGKLPTVTTTAVLLLTVAKLPDHAHSTVLAADARAALSAVAASTVLLLTRTKLPNHARSTVWAAIAPAALSAFTTATAVSLTAAGALPANVSASVSADAAAALSTVTGLVPDAPDRVSTTKPLAGSLSDAPGTLPHAVRVADLPNTDLPDAGLPERAHPMPDGIWMSHRLGRLSRESCGRR